MNIHRSCIGKIGRTVTHMTWALAILFIANSCNLSDIPIEPAGAPSTTQDNDGGGGGY